MHVDNLARIGMLCREKKRLGLMNALRFVARSTSCVVLE